MRPVRPVSAVRSDRESDLELIRGWSAAQTRHAQGLDSLGGLVRSLGLSRVMLVVDRGASEASGAMPRLRSSLDASLAVVFDEFSPNPDAEQTIAAATAAHREGVDGVVAFGGGSCIDVAKVAALAVADPNRIRNLCEGTAAANIPPLPVIAVPTTSGTGSEATHFAAVYVRGRKISVGHEQLRPKAVVMDVGVHMSCPSRVAAASGLDALCQAVESMWAISSTTESRRYASAAAGVIACSLESSVIDGDASSRAAMMWGAHAAGMAINISRTTAPHAVSYALTSRFGVPHGLAVALTIARFAVVNAGLSASRCRAPQGVEWVRARTIEAASMLGVEPHEMPTRMRRLLDRLGMPTSLSEAGVPRASLDGLATQVDPVRLSNHPASFTHDELVELLQACL